MYSSILVLSNENCSLNIPGFCFTGSLGGGAFFSSGNEDLFGGQQDPLGGGRAGGAIRYQKKCVSEQNTRCQC